MKSIAFSGSFDPVTNGHLWVINEALNIAEKVVVIVAQNPSKTNMFSHQLRMQMIREALSGDIKNRVQVVSTAGYVAQAAADYGCEYLIRGSRSSADYDYETVLSQANVNVLGGVKTLFVMPPRDLQSVSSSFVKSLIGPVGWHWHTAKFVPVNVQRELVRLKMVDIIFQGMNGGHEIDGYDVVRNDVTEVVDQVIAKYDRIGYHNYNHILFMFQMYAHHYDFMSDAMVWNIIAHDADEDFSAAAEWTYEVCAGKVGWYVDVGKTIKVTNYFDKQARSAPLTHLQRQLQCLDFAILGQPWHIYQEYAKNVRVEYPNAADAEYAEGRIKVLNQLINFDGGLFPLDAFEKYAAPAIANMQREIDLLQRNKL